MKKLIILISILFLSGSANLAFSQCSMCKANVKNGITSKDKKTGLGINDGIMSLVFVPYAAVGLVGFIWYRSYKQKVKTQGNE